MRALKTAGLGAGMLASMLVPAAMASDYDGSRPLVCASLEAIACRANVECKRGSVESLGIPQFFWVDVATKTVSERDPDGQVRSNAIQAVAQGPTHMILQGTKGNLGWSGTISKATGKLTLTGSDGADALVVFGACTPAK